jgi:hypothetical protein
LETRRSILPVSVLSADYQQTKSRACLSKKHIEDVLERLARFAADYGERDIKSIEPKELENWLHSLGLSAQSLNNFRTVVSGLFEYAGWSRHHQRLDNLIFVRSRYVREHHAHNFFIIRNETKRIIGALPSCQT